MPSLVLSTNVSASSIPKDFMKETTDIFQKAIGKPMQYICVHIVPDQMMTFGGTDAPCANVQVMSIGKLGIEENKTLSKIIFEQILAKLGIDKERAYITFNDKPRHEVGWNATTFHK